MHSVKVEQWWNLIPKIVIFSCTVHCQLSIELALAVMAKYLYLFTIFMSLLQIITSTYCTCTIIYYCKGFTKNNNSYFMNGFNLWRHFKYNNEVSWLIVSQVPNNKQVITFELRSYMVSEKIVYCLCSYDGSWKSLHNNSYWTL